MSANPVPMSPTVGAPLLVSPPPPPPPPPPGGTNAAPTTLPAGTPQSFVDREPVVTTATIIGLLSAIVSWAVANNYVGKAHEALLMAIIPTVAAVVFAYYGRRGVTSVGRAQIAIDGAYTAQPGRDPKPKL